MNKQKTYKPSVLRTVIERTGAATQVRNQFKTYEEFADEFEIARAGPLTMENELKFLHENILPDFYPSYKESLLGRRISYLLNIKSEELK